MNTTDHDLKQRNEELRKTIPFYKKHEAILWDAWLHPLGSILAYTTYYEWAKRRAELEAEFKEIQLEIFKRFATEEKRKATISS